MQVVLLALSAAGASYFGVSLVPASFHARNFLPCRNSRVEIIGPNAQFPDKPPTTLSICFEPCETLWGSSKELGKVSQ